jgi:hypothetical protein
MAVQSNSMSDKIVRAQVALKTGQLANYAPAKSVDPEKPQRPSSWGPAMRI